MLARMVSRVAADNFGAPTESTVGVGDEGPVDNLQRHRAVAGGVGRYETRLL